MATPQDFSVMAVKETTYGTPPTPTRGLEIISETFDLDKIIKQGAGLRVGGRMARSQRRVKVAQQIKGDMMWEVASKGQSTFWEWLLGASIVTLVSGTTFQHVFTLGDTPPSQTIQIGVPEVGGTVDQITFRGMMANQWELDFPNQDLLTCKATVDGQTLDTSTAYAAASYPSSPNLFSFIGGSVSSGTLTAPTATALGSATAPLADIRGGSLSYDNNLAGDRFNMVATGLKAKPTVGLRAGTGKVDVEYDSTTFRDAVINETPLCLVLNWSTGVALSTGVETLQVILPEVKFDSELPKSNGPDLVVPNLAFTVLDNLVAAQPIWVVLRTSDSAL